MKVNNPRSLKQCACTMYMYIYLVICNVGRFVFTCLYFAYEFSVVITFLVAIHQIGNIMAIRHI